MLYTNYTNATMDLNPHNNTLIFTSLNDPNIYNLKNFKLTPNTSKTAFLLEYVHNGITFYELFEIFGNKTVIRNIENQYNKYSDALMCANRAISAIGPTLGVNILQYINSKL